MNYRIPRAMCLAANYPVKNDPFLDVSVCVCVQMCVCVWGGWGGWHGPADVVDSYASPACLSVCPTQKHTHAHTHTNLNMAVHCDWWWSLFFFVYFVFWRLRRCSELSISLRGLRDFCYYTLGKAFFAGGDQFCIIHHNFSRQQTLYQNKRENFW